MARYRDCKIYVWNKKSQPTEDGFTALGLSGGLRSRHDKEIIHGKVTLFLFSLSQATELLLHR
jgi:hypothetical protein